MCHELFTACGDALEIALQVGRGRESHQLVSHSPQTAPGWNTPSAWRTIQGAHPGWAPSLAGHYPHPTRVDLAQKYLFNPHFSSLLIQQESTF